MWVTFRNSTGIKRDGRNWLFLRGVFCYTERGYLAPVWRTKTARVAKLVIRARLKISFPFIRKCEFDSHPGHRDLAFDVVRVQEPPHKEAVLRGLLAGSFLLARTARLSARHAFCPHMRGGVRDIGLIH